MNWSAILSLCVAAALSSVHADDFPKLDEAMPRNIDIRSITPMIDTDTDSCLPSAMVSRTGAQNAGLDPEWASLVKGCRNNDFMNLSNTYHRYVCQNNNGNQYCAHLFAYYFLKDQSVNLIPSGHKNDLEQVAVWTINGRVSHGSYSAHGKMYNKAASEIPTQDGHLKFVYHKDGGSTHCFRFAGNNEFAENPAGTFVTPTVVSWYTMKGDGIDNGGLRDRMNNYNYGSATMPIKDSTFLNNVNTYKPAEFPVFTQDSVNNSQ
ncbi:hypothetical protein Poli38472_009937 [Pythium oligandrum]|uniref:Necrosis inducing protein (NPP1) n=1 Tax=Pythium oligandrum TaxID=41045 RepID=A0A8K1FH36_PYTOL|nr:hypothetical protein Poli38472_009937 [Pythium oligandrum]|eukprot:TMW58378.1 hypothetical protein Poli38472_009937 [Pythium oligandrum]